MRIPILFAIFLCMVYSCTERDGTVRTLNEAQNIVGDNPEKALSMLDSIDSPEKMREEDYMRYAVIHTQAKLNTGSKTVGDTLVFDAERYFAKNEKSDMAALAHFYAGATSLKLGHHERAMQAFLKAETFATKNNNKLLTAKSIDNIAYLYFKQNVLDSAIARYHKSLSYYNKLENTEILRMNDYSLLGRSYRSLGLLDSASHYFQEGLEVATRAKSAEFKRIFQHNLGIIYCEKDDYRKAISLYNQAIASTTNPQDSLRLFTRYAIVYNKTNQLDSSKYYLDLVNTRLPQITNKYLLGEVYNSLSQYNRQIGNLEKALHYSSLEKETINRIHAESSASQLIEADSKYKILLYDKEMEKARIRTISIILTAILVVALITVTGYTRMQKIKQQHRLAEQQRNLLESENKLLDADNKLLESQNKLLDADNKLLTHQVTSLVSLRAIHAQVVERWNQIDHEITLLAKQFGTEKRPMLILKIAEMVKSLSQQTNELLTNLANDYIEKLPFGDQLKDRLKGNELYLLTLLYCGYCDTDIASILDLSPKKLYPLKLNLKHKLKEAGMDDRQIEAILFGEYAGNSLLFF